MTLYECFTLTWMMLLWCIGLAVAKTWWVFVLCLFPPAAWVNAFHHFFCILGWLG